MADCQRKQDFNVKSPIARPNNGTGKNVRYIS